MKIVKFDIIFILFLVIEFIVCFLLLNHLNIFQYMFFVQILPSIILGILAGRIAARSSSKWLILVVFSVIYALMMYLALKITPMTTIENNTIQSATSVFEFNRNIRPGTFVGFFIQEFFISGLVVIIIKLFRKIKEGNF